MGYGGAEVPAPQATLMKMIVEGIMGGNLPWNLVFTGVFLAIALEILRIPVMPFAIGLYLPIYLNTSIMIGGAVRWFMDSRKNVDAKLQGRADTRGTLFCCRYDRRRGPCGHPAGCVCRVRHQHCPEH